MPITKSKPRVRVKSARAASRVKVRYSFKVEGELNISPYVSQQTVNGSLLKRVPNLIGADEPELQLQPQGAFWSVPVILTIPTVGHFGPLGQIVVDAETGNILEEESTSCEEIEKEAERLAPKEVL